MRHLKVGKAHEGYWNHDNTLVHTVDMIDVFDVLFGKYAGAYLWYIGYDCKAMFHFDWSSGHGAYKDGALNVGAMGGKWGGAQAVTHDTKIDCVDGFLGPCEAKCVVGNVTVEYKLKVGAGSNFITSL